MDNADQPYDEEARKRTAEKLFRESIEHVTEKEIVTAAELGKEKARRVEPDIPSALESVWRELKLMISMLRDYVRGAYREIPFGSMAAVAAAVLYFASPVDAIPDFIPGLGYVDDAAVLMLCLRMIRSDVEKYRDWAALHLD
jgi:uncharacterized membrane protein YkvA (DUF1232 family)